VKSLGIDVQKLILDILVFLASAMIVVSIGGDVLKIGSAGFMALLSWSVELAYIVKLRSRADRFVAGSSAGSPLRGRLKR